MTFITMTALIMLYRCMIVAIAGMCIWVGYKLLQQGPYRQPGESQPNDQTNSVIETTVGGATVMLKNVASGTVFAVFGAVILVFSLLNAPTFSNTQGVIDTPASSPTDSVVHSPNPGGQKP